MRLCSYLIMFQHFKHSYYCANKYIYRHMYAYAQNIATDHDYLKLISSNTISRIGRCTLRWIMLRYGRELRFNFGYIIQHKCEHYYLQVSIRKHHTGRITVLLCNNIKLVSSISNREPLITTVHALCPFS